MQSFCPRLAKSSRQDNLVRKESRQTGSAAAALLLGVSLAVLVAITVYIFAVKLFTAPPPITSIGREVDHQYNLTLYATGAVFVLAQLGLAYAIFRFRDRGQAAKFSRGNVAMEILWT